MRRAPPAISSMIDPWRTDERPLSLFLSFLHSGVLLPLSSAVPLLGQDFLTEHPWAASGPLFVWKKSTSPDSLVLKNNEASSNGLGDASLQQIFPIALLSKLGWRRHPSSAVTAASGRRGGGRTKVPRKTGSNGSLHGHTHLYSRGLNIVCSTRPNGESIW